MEEYRVTFNLHRTSLSKLFYINSRLDENKVGLPCHFFNPNITSGSNWCKPVQMRRDPQVYCLTLLSIPYGAVTFSLPERASCRSARPTPEEKLSGGAFYPLQLASHCFYFNQELKSLLCSQRHP